jgi:hypothetical protein
MGYIVGLINRIEQNRILVESVMFTACKCKYTYYIILLSLLLLYFGRTYYISTDSIYVKFVGHNL